MALVESKAAGNKCLVSTSIPDEAIITNLVTEIPLKDVDQWLCY